MIKFLSGALVALCVVAFGGAATAQTPPASMLNSAGIYVPVGVTYCVNCSGGGGGGGTVFETAGGFADLTTMIADINALSATTNSLLKAGQSINVGNLPATQPISAAALPLPTGAATETGNLAAAKADLDTAIAELGALGVSPCSGDSGTCALNALIQRTNQNVTTLTAAVNSLNSAVATLNTTAAAMAGYLNTLQGAINSATPNGGNFTGYTDLQQGSNNLTITSSGAAKVDGSGVTQPVSVQNFTTYTTGPAGGAINIAAAATTQLITASGSTTTYITHLDVEAGGAGNFTLEYGTGTLCGTGTVAMTGPYNLTAQSGIVLGNGGYPVLKPVPSGNNVCAVTSAAVQMSGSILASQQ